MGSYPAGLAGARGSPCLICLRFVTVTVVPENRMRKVTARNPMYRALSATDTCAISKTSGRGLSLKLFHVQLCQLLNEQWMHEINFLCVSSIYDLSSTPPTGQIRRVSRSSASYTPPSQKSKNRFCSLRTVCSVFRSRTRASGYHPSRDAEDSKGTQSSGGTT